MRMTQHSKQRLVERDEGINTIAEAKRVAKQAFISGKTLGYFQKCPKFYKYLERKNNQTRECVVKVYRGNIYIWKSRRHNLVTVHSIPECFKEELENDD